MRIRTCIDLLAGAASSRTMPKLRGRELRCFFDLTIEGEPFGRLVFRLRPDVVPKTSENFRALCTGEKGYGFKGTKFHRIVKGYLAQAGDFAGKHEGTGGFSIYKDDDEGKFEDENFILKHSGPGVLSMANCGPNTNGGQFFITFRKLEELDGKNVVFGSVVEGIDLVWQMEEFGSEYGGKPDKHVVIADCGEVTDDPVSAPRPKPDDSP